MKNFIANETNASISSFVASKKKRGKRRKIKKRERTYKSSSGGHGNVDGVNLVFLDGALVNFHLYCGCVDDDLLSVDEVAAHLVRENALQRTHIIRLCNGGNHFSDLSVLWREKGYYVC